MSGTKKIESLLLVRLEWSEGIEDRRWTICAFDCSQWTTLGHTSTDDCGTNWQTETTVSLESSLIISRRENERERDESFADRWTRGWEIDRYQSNLATCLRSFAFIDRRLAHSNALPFSNSSGSSTRSFLVDRSSSSILSLCSVDLHLSVRCRISRALLWSSFVEVPSIEAKSKWWNIWISMTNVRYRLIFSIIARHRNCTSLSILPAEEFFSKMSFLSTGFTKRQQNESFDRHLNLHITS